MTLIIERLVGLRHNVLVFYIGGHIHYFIGHHTALFVNAAVRRFNEAILVNFSKGCQVGNQTDVRTFGRLNRAHAAIVRVVNVTNFEARAVTRQTAGAQRGQTALMRQLSQRVVLIHELRQRRRAEELFDCRHNRANVDQRLRGHLFGVLCLERHALADHALHTGKADAELVLQKLAHAADTAVAQMVDIVGSTNAVSQAVQIVNRGENVVQGHCLADQLVLVFHNQLFLLFRVGRLVQNSTHLLKADALIDAQLLRIEAEEVVGIDGAVGNYLYFTVINIQKYNAHAAFLNFPSQIRADFLAGSAQQLTGQRSNDVSCSLMAHDAAGNRQLFIHFVTAKTGQIVAARVEEQAFQVVGSALDCRGLARTQLAVCLQKALFLVLGRVFCNRRLYALVIAKKLTDARVIAKAHCTQQNRHRNFAVFINTHIEHVVGIRFILQPSAAVRVQCCGKELFTGFVIALAKVNAGAAHQLADNNTLGAVVDKGACVCHQGKISHENLLLLQVARLFVQQTSTHTQRRGIGGVALFALFDAVLGL